MSYRIAVDLDGVILEYKTSKLFKKDENTMPYSKYGTLLPGAKEALAAFHKAGHEVVILTRRTDRTLLYSHLRTKLKLQFTALMSPAKDISYDMHIASGGIAFTGAWDKAQAEVDKFIARGTWEERKLRSKVKRGLSEQTKGII